MRESVCARVLYWRSCLFSYSEEQDEETIEWEQEQLRRGGLQAEDTAEKAAKPVYKPAPGEFSYTHSG